VLLRLSRSLWLAGAKSLNSQTIKPRYGPARDFILGMARSSAPVLDMRGTRLCPAIPRSRVTGMATASTGALGGLHNPGRLNDMGAFLSTHGRHQTSRRMDCAYLAKPVAIACISFA